MDLVQNSTRASVSLTRQMSVKFVGHEITREALKLEQQEVTTTDELGEPNETEVQRLLGIVQYLQ